jgi:hypothetical protein
MKYRTFGKLDWKPSALGFGMMRLPLTDDKPENIDEAEATRMVRHAIDSGVNYIDTAYPYHGGKSEGFTGRVLKDGYREKVRVATKMPGWFVKTPDDFDKYFDEQLERLQMDYVDFYLLHALSGERWEQLSALNVLDWCERQMADGRIKYLGFSFHDDLEAFKKIVDGYDNWTFCQIQYNYMDIEHQAGTEGLKYAADKGLAVVIMEPVRGGRIANPPDAVTKLWASAPVQRTPVDWALQWIWNQPEVSLLLSGMSAMQHVEENIASADASGAGTLTADELALIDQAREAYRELIAIDCTGCEYCLPCPNGVEIPRIFEIYNEAMMYKDIAGSRMFYSWLKEESRADQCLQCGECEAQCPQNITIIEWLEKAHELLSAQA